MARLRKAEVEVLLAGDDADLLAALTTALRVVLEQPRGSWTELVAALPKERQAALLAHDQASLDRLLTDLNEVRTLPGAPGC